MNNRGTYIRANVSILIAFFSILFYRMQIGGSLRNILSITAAVAIAVNVFLYVYFKAIKPR
jgi:hypothetical protein